MVILDKNSHELQLIARNPSTVNGILQIKNGINNIKDDISCVFTTGTTGKLQVTLAETLPIGSYIVKLLDANDNQLFYGQLLVLDENEDLQEYKTYRNKTILKL